MVPQDVGERGAGLGVCLGVGQLVVVAERLAVVARADSTGEVDAPAHDVAPQRVERDDVGVLASERGDIGHAAIQVARTHGVADRLPLLGHRQVVLHVARVAEAGLQVTAVGLAALVEKELRQLQVAAFAGRAIQLHQADLDLLVARHVANPAGPEHAVDQLRVADRHLQQGTLAGGLVMGHGRLVQVADVVELVVDLQVRPAREPLPLRIHPRGIDGAGGVEVAVLLLGPRDLGDEGVEIGVELGVGVAMQRIGGPLHHLEHVGVVEEDALVRPLHEPGGLGEVVDAAGLLALAEVVGNRYPAVGHDPGLPEAIVESHPREGNRRHWVVHIDIYDMVLTRPWNA